MYSIIRTVSKTVSQNIQDFLKFDSIFIQIATCLVAGMLCGVLMRSALSSKNTFEVYYLGFIILVDCLTSIALILKEITLPVLLPYRNAIIKFLIFSLSFLTILNWLGAALFSPSGAFYIILILKGTMYRSTLRLVTYSPSTGLTNCVTKANM